MKRFIAQFAIPCLLLLTVHIAFARQGSIAYAWTSGDLVFAYPAGWSTPEELGDTDVLRLRLTDAAQPATQLFIDRVTLPQRRVFDLMASALEGEGVRVGAPTDAQLVNVAALEVHERSADSPLVGIGRGTILGDGSALLVWGVAAREHGNALLLAFDQVVRSLVLGARQMPLQTDGTPYARIGAEIVQAEQPVLGALSPDAPTQRWGYVGVSGETISLYALDINRTETLNLRLRLAAPEGTVIAENDNHSGAAFYGLFSLYDAGLYDVTLPIDGMYTIEVSSVFGEGIYGLGVRRAETFTLIEGEAMRLYGSISDVFANQSWWFEGQANRIYTFTMFADGDTSLDPALRLHRPDGRVLAENDDARDPALGFNAQIIQVELPEDGRYRLEATRYAGAGEGDYEIVVVETAR